MGPLGLVGRGSQGTQRPQVSGWLMSLHYSLSSKGSPRACDKCERAEACMGYRQAQIHGVEPRPCFSTNPAGSTTQDGAGCLAALTRIHSHVKEGARSTGSRLVSSLSLSWSPGAPLVQPACSADVGTRAQRQRPGLPSTEHPGHLEKPQFPSGSGQKPFPLGSNLILWAGQSRTPSIPPAPRVQSKTALSGLKLLQLGPGSCSPGLLGLRRLSGLVGEEKKEWHCPRAPLVLGPTQAPSSALSLSCPASGYPLLASLSPELCNISYF